VDATGQGRNLETKLPIRNLKNPPSNEINLSNGEGNRDECERRNRVNNPNNRPKILSYARALAMSDALKGTGELFFSIIGCTRRHFIEEHPEEAG